MSDYTKEQKEYIDSVIEFTKSIKADWPFIKVDNDPMQIAHDKSVGSAIIWFADKLEQACDIIDRQTAENNKLKAYLIKHFIDTCPDAYCPYQYKTNKKHCEECASGWITEILKS